MPVPTPSRILVVGSGGREHALAWRLARDPGVERVLAAPGNPGHADWAEVHPEAPITDLPAIVALARSEMVDLVVVGPEAPLVAGLADRLSEAGIPVFGPSAAAAAGEGSKSLCREVAAQAGIPMAEGQTFSDVPAARAYVRRLGLPVVVKADGLAAGKGVTMCATVEEADEALEAALERGVFGRAGNRVVVERALHGPEASLIAICDGSTALALPAARDHKRIGDGDQGPNTGGMGAYSPLPDLPDVACAELVRRIHRPALDALAARGTPFRGALYAGLMLTAEGPRLLEFNARFGDPETQAMLPRLATPLAPLLLAAATGRLGEAAWERGIAGPMLPVHAEAAVAVVLAAEGYPGHVRSGDPVTGIADAEADGALVFHAGTAERSDGTTVTAGGRVLAVVATGSSLSSASAAAYHAADLVHIRGRQMRRDIGTAPLATSASRTATPGPAGTTGEGQRP